MKLIQFVRFWWNPTSQGALDITRSVERYMRQEHLHKAIEYLETIEVLRKPPISYIGSSEGRI